MERLAQRIQMARRALATLQELTPIASPTPVERDAAIQRFEDRNLTSHTYNEALAQAIWSRLPTHLSVLQRWMTALEGLTNQPL